MKYEDWVRYDKGDNKMGLDVYLANGKTYNTEWECDDYETIEINSTLYPEHLFKIGYFRSSYNSGGINRVANRYSLLDLYDIFDPHSYTFIPDWADAMKKCEAAIKQWDAYAMSDIGQTEWYTQALAIVKETIAWVLAQDNTEEYFLVWSS